MLLAVLLLCAIDVTAYAHDVPDISKKGSISVTVLYDNQPVSGGTLTLYKVGNIKENDGDYSFGLTADFIGSGVKLTDISSADLAVALENYAVKQGCDGIEKEIGKDGKISYSELDLGLYLLVQNKAADGYNKMTSFLVSIPMNENGVYIYDVDASPKAELEKEPAPETDETTPPKTPPTTPPTTPPKTPNRLPQTGQLNWPIPVLVISGMIVFALGWILRFGRGSEYNEK